MKQHIHISRTMLSVAISILLVLPVTALVNAATVTQPSVTAAPVKDIYITEVQTASAASAGEEFVEFYNATDKDIDFSDSAHNGKDTWKLQYFLGSKYSSVTAPNAPAASWVSPSGTISLTGTIPAHDYYVLAGTTTSGAYAPGSIDADQVYSPHLSNDAAVQLVDIPAANSFITHDRLIWSSDPDKFSINNMIYSAPLPGSSLQRLPNDDLSYSSTNGSLTGFAVKSELSPRAAWTAPTIPVGTSPDPGQSSDPPGTDPDEPTDQTPVTVVNGPKPIRITEILPNPASPLTDARDEYIELYNPNDTPYDLKGLILESGEVTKHDFIFSDGTIPGNTYAAFYASTTGIPLSNSGGKVSLLQADGTVMSVSDTYGTALEGQAWAYNPATDNWQWTLTPTPGEANAVTAPSAVVLSSASNTKKPAIPKKVSAKAKGTATTKKSKSSTAKKTKTGKQKTAKSVKPVAYSSTVTAPAAPIHTSVLAIVALLAVAYVIYEYRRDIANKIHQLRTNRGGSRTDRS